MTSEYEQTLAQFDAEVAAMSDWERLRFKNALAEVRAVVERHGGPGLMAMAYLSTEALIEGRRSLC